MLMYQINTCVRLESMTKIGLQQIKKKILCGKNELQVVEKNQALLCNANACPGEMQNLVLVSLIIMVVGGVASQLASYSMFYLNYKPNNHCNPNIIVV